VFFFRVRPNSNRTCQPTIVAEKSLNEYQIGVNALFRFSAVRHAGTAGSPPDMALTTHRVAYPTDAILTQLNAN
jgi:hypothetical protein